MPTDLYFGDDITIATFQEADGSTSLTAGKARSGNVRAEADHVELFTTDSITRDEVKRRELVVIVELEFVEFNEDIVQYWLDGTGSTSTTINDDSAVQEYDITLEQLMTDHTGSSGDEKLKAAVTGVHFPEMPMIDFSEGEYSAKSLTGRGDAITLTKESVA